MKLLRRQNNMRPHALPKTKQLLLYSGRRTNYGRICYPPVSHRKWHPLSTFELPYKCRPAPRLKAGIRQPAAHAAPHTSLTPPSFNNHMPFILHSYTPRNPLTPNHTPLIHPSNTPHTPLIHPSYTPHPPLIHPSYTPHTPRTPCLGALHVVPRRPFRALALRPAIPRKQALHGAWSPSSHVSTSCLLGPPV